jgi:tetratricopeptide (TPR) repeat protein
MRALVIALVLGFVALPSVARADDTAEAEKLYNEGKRLYNLGKFDEALTNFESAYDLYRAPEFLFNIGQCYRNLKKWEKGIFVFESYLREKPKTTKRKLVEDLIAEMKKELAAENERLAQENAANAELERKRKEADLEISKKEREHQLELVRKQKEAELAILEKQRERDLEAAEERRRHPPIYKKWWFWTIAGAVAIGAGGGIYFATTGDELPAGSLGTIDGR